MHYDDCNTDVQRLCQEWTRRLQLPDDRLFVTTSRQTFETWLGRRVGARIGGGYAFIPRTQSHIVLINLPRIDQSQPKALELVVCEELLHMRHRLDGDVRRHSRHGYDRIAHQVAELTGSTLEEVRGALLPLERREYRYRYECPTCHRSILRRKRGLWSCGICSPRFSRKHVLVLVEDLRPEGSQASGIAR